MLSTRKSSSSPSATSPPHVVYKRTLDNVHPTGGHLVERETRIQTAGLWNLKTGLNVSFEILACLLDEIALNGVMIGDLISLRGSCSSVGVRERSQ
ncbi:hypothetical protein BaRGS_00032947 [Batillaria attramentaria]|uniref:Uncharacterized protein n=1 Tax=Batillaria attramentaria TaxID=370345 RepID=A0ABD0JM94_9CAEN